MDRGSDIRGICWYPITAYPSWAFLGTPRPDFYRPSLQRAFAMWTSHCCGKWRCNVNCSSNGKGGMSTTGKRD